MDQQSPHRTESETLAARSAAAVQALRNRAQKSHDERKTRLAEFEDRIAAQLELVGEELARDVAVTEHASASAERAVVEELRQELERERDEWAALRRDQEAETAAHREQIEQRSAELANESADLEARSAELAERLAELESAREQFHIEQESAAESEREELEQLQNQLENERTGRRSEREELEARLREQSQRIEQLCQERDDARKRLGDLERAAQVDATNAHNELKARAEEWQGERERLTEERDSLAAEAKALRGKLETAVEREAASGAELTEVARKFELAIEDVRRLRERISELERELADRPARDESDSSDLIQLRNERDELVERVAALESQLEQSAAATDADADQALADLRRRFELAVEDVRQLKTEKEKLEQQLKAARSTSVAAVEPAGSDWEAQKRVLLASLEGEDAPTPERQEEQRSIEDTIRITDEVIAEKDRELAELREQLEAVANESPEEQVLASDELIRAERERLAALETEINEKLRAAEMELSTARARLARQETELEKQRVELEALKNSGYGQTAGGAQVPARRRWLDKLGLGGDDGK